MTFSQFAVALVLIAASALTWFGVELTVAVLLVSRLCYALYLTAESVRMRVNGLPAFAKPEIRRGWRPARTLTYQPNMRITIRRYGDPGGKNR